MVMQENNETGYTLSIDYAFNPHFAVGIYSKYEINQDEFWIAGPQLNALIKRDGTCRTDRETFSV